MIQTHTKSIGQATHESSLPSHGYSSSGTCEGSCAQSAHWLHKPSSFDNWPPGIWSKPNAQVKANAHKCELHFEAQLLLQPRPQVACKQLHGLSVKTLLTPKLEWPWHQCASHAQEGSPSLPPPLQGTPPNMWSCCHEVGKSAVGWTSWKKYINMDQHGKMEMPQIEMQTTVVHHVHHSIIQLHQYTKNPAQMPKWIPNADWKAECNELLQVPALSKGYMNEGETQLVKYFVTVRSSLCKAAFSPTARKCLEILPSSVAQDKGVKGGASSTLLIEATMADTSWEELMPRIISRVNAYQIKQNKTV